MFIQTETTNDAQAMRFLPGRDVTGAGAVIFSDAADAPRSPLAQRLFGVDGVAAVALGAGDITVTKTDDGDWQELKPAVLRAIMEHFTSDEPVILAGAEPEFVGDADDDIAAQIRELIDTKIYPSVAQGGGSIAFRGYENGVVLLDPSPDWEDMAEWYRQNSPHRLAQFERGQRLVPKLFKVMMPHVEPGDCRDAVGS